MGGSEVGESSSCTQHPGLLTSGATSCCSISSHASMFSRQGQRRGSPKKKSNKNFNPGETPLLLPYQNKYVLPHGFCVFTGVVTPLSLPCMRVYSRECPSLDYVSLRVSLLIVNFLSFQCLGRCLSNSICLRLFQFKVLFFFSSLSNLSQIRGPATELTDGIAYYHQTLQNLELRREMPLHGQWTESRPS